nr:DUF1761 domain-containing protein [Flavobacterium sp. ASV13]
MNILLEINWLSITIGTIFYCLFCGMWHKQFAFGKKWKKAMGFKDTENWQETSIYYIIPLISCFITTIAIAILLKLLKAACFYDALKLGIILGIGFAMAIVFTTSTIPVIKKTLLFGTITGTAQALGIIITSLIVYYISVN